MLGEVLADRDPVAPWGLQCRNCLIGEVLSDVHGIAPGHRELSGLWPLRVVDWRQYQVARWWPLWVVPWRVYKPRDKVT